MHEACRSARGHARRFLPLLMAAVAGCGPSRAQLKERDDQAQYHYDLAYGYFFDEHNPRGDAALLEVLKSLEIKEQNADAHLLAGLVFMGRDRNLDAIAHFQRAIELNPDLHYAHNNLAATYLAMERWDDAIAILDRLVSNMLYDRQGHAHNNLGWAWYKKGDLVRARRHYDAAIQLASDLCPPYNNLGLLLIEQNQLDQAEKYLRRGLARCPTYAEPWMHLGRIQARKGDAKGARDSFERCLKFAGESPLADRCERLLSPLVAGDAR